MKIALKKLASTAASWVARRAKEKSTYVGLATVAAALGHETLGAQIGQVGQIVGVVLGTGLITATTSAHPAG